MTHLVPYGTEPKPDRRRRLAQQSMRLAALRRPTDRRRMALNRMRDVLAARRLTDLALLATAVTPQTCSDWTARYFLALATEFNVRTRR